MQSQDDLLEIFVSYAHTDEQMMMDMLKHMSTIEQVGRAIAWYDRKIAAGGAWNAEIHKHLETASVVLLLITKDFVASEYCRDIEVKRAMERHDSGDACVIPVILRPVDWDGLPFSKLQALPVDGKAVSEWRIRDKAYAQIAQGVRHTIERNYAITQGDNSGVDKAADVSDGERAGNVLTSTDTTEIELVLDRDYDSYCAADRVELLDAIENLLRVSKIVVVRQRRGSVKLTVRLDAAHATELLRVSHSGALRQFGVIGAEAVVSKTANIELQEEDPSLRETGTVQLGSTSEIDDPTLRIKVSYQDESPADGMNDTQGSIEDTYSSRTVHGTSDETECAQHSGDKYICAVELSDLKDTVSQLDSIVRNFRQERNELFKQRDRSISTDSRRADDNIIAALSDLKESMNRVEAELERSSVDVERKIDRVFWVVSLLAGAVTGAAIVWLAI